MKLEVGDWYKKYDGSTTKIMWYDIEKDRYLDICGYFYDEKGKCLNYDYYINKKGLNIKRKCTIISLIRTFTKKTFFE